MKIFVLLLASVGFLLAFLAWQLLFKTSLSAHSPVAAQAKPAQSPAANPTTLGDLKALFFADQSLEEITQKVETTRTATAHDPWSLFASALAESRKGKIDEAKKYLKRVLTIPEGES